MFPEGEDHTSGPVLWRGLCYPYSVDNVGEPVDGMVTIFKHFCCNVAGIRSSVVVELFEDQYDFFLSDRVNTAYGVSISALGC